MLEERLDGLVQSVEDLLSCLRVEFPQQWVSAPLGSEDPTLLAVRGGEPFLFPAPLPVRECVVPELPPCLDHPQQLLLLLAVWVQTEPERRLHANQMILYCTAIPFKPQCDSFIPRLKPVGFLA
jgi:hypothetical protein